VPPSPHQRPFGLPDTITIPADLLPHATGVMPPYFPAPNPCKYMHVCQSDHLLSQQSASLLISVHNTAVHIKQAGECTHEIERAVRPHIE
jgi:hypothetical protein